VAFAGILLVGAQTVSARPARILLGTFTLFAAAVIATQYAKGGTAEWGGRYFAIGLPLLVPVALLAIRDRARALAPTTARVAAGALVACTVLTAAVGVAALRYAHGFTADAMTTIDRAAGAGAGAGPDQPVVIATSGAVPRLAWATFDRQRWLLVPPDELAAVIARLRQADIHRATFVTHDAEHETPNLGPGVTVGATAPSPGNGWAVLSLDLGRS